MGNEITPGVIEGYTEIELKIRCAHCGQTEATAIGDLHDIVDLTEELCDTCTGDGWEYGVAGDNEGVYCGDCIEK